MTSPDRMDGARQYARAEDFLRLRLAQGAALVAVVKKDARRYRVSWAFVKAARLALQVDSHPTEEGQVWWLPSNHNTHSMHQGGFHDHT
jgi:hypothetical protein